MAGLISKEDGLFKVTFPFSGELHELHSLRSLAEAGLVGMVLAVRAAEELQQALDAVAPGVRGLPSFRLSKAAGLDVSRLPPASLSQLAEQLQACVDWRNAELRSPVLAEWDEHENTGMAPLCGLLAAAASLGCAAAVRQLAQLDPSAALVEWPWEGEGSAVHRAAEQGHAEALRALLAAVPGAALATSSGYCCKREWEHDEWSVMHSAAEGGSLEAVLVLLEAAPEIAAAVTDCCLTPLHVAAAAGHAPVVQALLQAGPEAALVADEDGQLPLHCGAGHLQVALLLLAAAPGTALACTADGSTALHRAASWGATASAQALLHAAPQAALVADDSSRLPLHSGVSHVEVVQLLLAAALTTALACSAEGWTALHLAASEGAHASVQVLLRAGPEAAGMSDAEGRTPLQCGLEYLTEYDGLEDLPALRILVAALPSPATFAAIAYSDCIDDYHGPLAPPLFADFIAAAPPLTAEQWACVPAGCPRLGRAMPAALAHSHEQARQLVQRLPPADASRLHTFTLALARLQRRLGVALPGEVAGRLLSLCLAD